MALSKDEALAKAAELAELQTGERAQLDILRRYWRGRQRLPAVVPSSAPSEVREMARTSRVNVIEIVVESLTQALFVDGLRATDAKSGDDVTVPLWSAWTANRMAKHQSGLYRATVAYGTGYMVMTPGDPVPVMRPVSPRMLTAQYGDDPDWPRYALEKRPAAGDWRLYDDELVWPLTRQGASSGFELGGEPVPHGSPWTPVVRYRDAEDLDLDDDAEPEVLAGGPGGLGELRMVTGQVAPLIPLQDQINLTSFSLRAAEWYSAFRQRWIAGWTPPSSDAKMRAAASQMWTFEEHPDDIALGEFSQTELRGYLESRESGMKYAATLSQTPVHELTGQLVNLSAEALAAAEIGRERKADERQTGLGASHLQTMEVVAAMMGEPLPDDTQVVWRDTSARAFGAVVDGLGKLAQMLGIPPQELWDRVPGATAQDVRRWKTTAAQGDALGNLTALLERQAGGTGTGGERTSQGGLILPPGVEA
ncbi:phage portal protein [Micromonospora sp. NPDC047465]|uniref:phage portal protein n=1 Tax=Micromonospora sp. NPDC047465 TaxID=3154813 RepID=UPI0033F75BE5